MEFEAHRQAVKAEASDGNIPQHKTISELAKGLLQPISTVPKAQDQRSSRSRSAMRSAAGKPVETIERELVFGPGPKGESSS